MITKGQCSRATPWLVPAEAASTTNAPKDWRDYIVRIQDTRM